MWENKLINKANIAKQNSAVKEALIQIETAYSKKEKNNSFEGFLEKYQGKNIDELNNLLPWQREVLSALSTLYNAGFLEAANYIDNMR